MSADALRACVEQSSRRLTRWPHITRWPHRLLPRPWHELPNHAPCVQAARPSVLMYKPPNSPLEMPPSLSWRIIGACRSPGPRTRDSSRGSSRVMHTIAHGQPIRRLRRNPERFGSCEARRHHSDGKSTTLCSCRPHRSCSIAGCQAFEASMRRWGCAGRSYPSHSTSRSRAIWWERGAWREQVAPIQRSHIGMGLLCAQERSRQIRHIRMVNARPDART
jgi:hypothetical protein